MQERHAGSPDRVDGDRPRGRAKPMLLRLAVRCRAGTTRTCAAWATAARTAGSCRMWRSWARCSPVCWRGAPTHALVSHSM